MQFQKVWPMNTFKTQNVFGEAKDLLRNEFDKLKFNRNVENRIINFKALCRGDNLKSDEETAKLVCYYDRTIHPYLYLRPLKVEIHNWEPIIYQVHDFLGEWSLHEMGIGAVSAIASAVESGLYLPPQEDAFSTYSFSWIFEDSVPVFQKLTEKLAKLVGLVDSNHGFVEVSKGSYQISAYAVGNHYEPCTQCYDFKV